MTRCQLAASAVLISCITTSLGAQQASVPLPAAPGRLVDIGGRRMHLLCSGAGTPTVIFEAGASSFAIDWTLVQQDVAKSNRACSYDRAGMGWSDERPDGAGGTTAGDLHKLIETAGERGPFVLVGASRGGLLVRTYLAEYPSDVVAFVFVDPSSEDRLFTMLDGKGVLIAELTPEQLRSTMPTAPVQVSRRSPQMGPPFDRLPSELYQTRIKLDERLIAGIPSSVPAEVVAKSQEQERASLARLLAARRATKYAFGDRPTVVLTRGDEQNREREAVHRALADLSTNSRHTVVAGAGHEIHLFEPAVVVQAIQDVVQSVRTKARLVVR